MSKVDIDLDRKIASNWREYLKDSVTSIKELFQWIWRELISPEGKKEAKKMMYYLIIQCVIVVSLPLTIRWVFDGQKERGGV